MPDALQTPDYVRPDLEAALPDLQLIHDLLGGTRAMHTSKHLNEYIVKWPDEDTATWGARATSGTLYEGLARTVSAAVGMLFAQPPVVTYRAQEALLGPQLANVDAAGNALPVWLKRFSEQAVADGLVLGLVDFPRAPEGAVVTRATEADLNLRARWTYYHRASILSWRVGVVNNRLETLQVVLHEPTDVTTGDYGTATAHRYRVLKVVDGIAGFEVWQKPEAQGEQWRIVEQGTFRNRRGDTRSTLPIAVAYAGRTDAPFTAQPPLMGVAWANLAHFRHKTELAWGRRIAGIEQLVITGELAPNPDGTPQTHVPIGWEQVIKTVQGATAQWIGPSGKGLDQHKQGMLEAEQEMAALGMSFLSRDTRAQETAEAKRLDATAENSTLATAAQAIEDAANLLLEHHAWYEGLAKADAPTIAINRDYDLRGFSSADLAAAVALAESGYPKRALVGVLQKLGFIATTDPDELDDLALQWEAGGDAAAELKRLESEANRPPLPRAA